MCWWRKSILLGCASSFKLVSLYLKLKQHVVFRNMFCTHYEVNYSTLRGNSRDISVILLEKGYPSHHALFRKHEFLTTVLY